jgi:hypothetical protein
VAIEISSQKRWIKYDRLLLTEFYFMFNVLAETPSETGYHICTFPTYYTHTVQFIAIFANAYVQFDVGSPLLPILG